jgi:hypothetical protein
MKIQLFYSPQGMVTKNKDFDRLLVISALGPYAMTPMDYDVQTRSPFSFR